MSTTPPPPPPPPSGAPPPPPPQQPPGGYGAGGYGPGGYGAAGVPQEHPKGTTILVLGILSLVCCGLLGPVAWIMGSGARKEMSARDDVLWTNRGAVTAGWVCGIIGSVVLMLSVAYIVIVFALFAGTN